MRPVLVSLLLLVACGKGDKPPPPSSGALLTQESGPGQPAQGGQGGQMKAPIRHDGPMDAATVYERQCAMCHGKTGHGDGISAGALVVKPRDYTDPKWQASITDEDIKRTIILGGKAMGKSESMQPFPHLEKQPEVLDGLVKIIRGFGKK